MLNGPVGLFKTISVETVTGPIKDSKGAGPVPLNTNLGCVILVPFAANPPKLSFVKG